ncbi:DUF3617 domain-containing protein [Pseudomonas sp. Gutcm_11s]|uniref:DUF3617 domain-containing protein n=1 Tax=Pseudomonas sp. Gutcm_11s TaxID=3026088 RepID=UPI00235E484A|nr:DUF3617 domain-containing protein [Pseudomonas sp. Gutcm_11s]MDD0844810.1 DUF3617 domain-containing protein [Pseudomonas sp. Gutcm_11s]
MSPTRLLSLALCLLPAIAVAEIRPGLWEFSGQAQRGDQQMPNMQEMLGQLQNLPPEQRQIMEQMLAQKGVKLGSSGVQLCISPESAKGQNIPLQDPSSGCSHEITERTADLWKFRFTCPNGQGEGETRFQSDTAFTTQVKGVYDGHESTMNSEAHWVGEDCGGLPPR